MQTTAERALAWVATFPEGEALAPKEFLHLGERAAVDQALSRLVRRGQLLRVGRGFYTAPVPTRWGTRAPPPSKVVHAIAKRTGETVTKSREQAAWRLGWTTQRPPRHVYLVSGRSRTLALGNSRVELVHAPFWQLQDPSSRAGDALRALAWAGPGEARARVAQLREQFRRGELERLFFLRRSTPTWLIRELNTLALPA